MKSSISPGNLVVLSTKWYKGCWLWKYRCEGLEQINWLQNVPAVFLGEIETSDDSGRQHTELLLLIDDSVYTVYASLSYGIIKRFRDTK